jgi:hypothetical protein
MLLLTVKDSRDVAAHSTSKQERNKKKRKKKKIEEQHHPAFRCGLPPQGPQLWNLPFN